MAKKSKETNIPLIFALVLFILATIAFGVMWYMGLAEQEKLAAEKKKAVDDQAPLRAQKDDAERMVLLYRTYLGIAEDPDRNTIKTEAKANDKYAGELEKINYAVAKQFSKPGADDKTDYDTLYNKLPETLQLWKLTVGSDGTKTVAAPPPTGLIHRYGELVGKEVVYEAVKKERDTYAAQIAAMKEALKELASSKEKYDDEAKKFPDKVKKIFEDSAKSVDTRTADYQKDIKAANDKIGVLTETLDDLKRKYDKLDKEYTKAKADLQATTVAKSTVDRESFTLDEPQGKILRKRPDGAIEISVGRADRVHPGVTFSVFPPDYQVKGPTSRMYKRLVSDGRGGIEEKRDKEPQPKAKIEVYEVLGENLSLARITWEPDPIRDGATVGDLLYSNSWRRGVGDHVALVGMFDINGDGTDDIEALARDLARVRGITVDAYFDLRRREWVGKVTERTRYVVEGRRALLGEFDTNLNEKVKLNDAIQAALEDAARKGAVAIPYRDYFHRSGYKFEPNVKDEKLKEAVAPYLSGTGVEAPPPKP